MKIVAGGGTKKSEILGCPEKVVRRRVVVPRKWGARFGVSVFLQFQSQGTAGGSKSSLMVWRHGPRLHVSSTKGAYTCVKALLPKTPKALIRVSPNASDESDGARFARLLLLASLARFLTG